MKINNIILSAKFSAKEKDRKREIMKIKEKMESKIQVIDFDFTNIKKSDYFIHDFFLIKSNVYIVYKYQNYRILIYVDMENKSFIIIQAFMKKKNHQKYYDDFIKYARKVGN